MKAPLIAFLGAVLWATLVLYLVGDKVPRGALVALCWGGAVLVGLAVGGWSRDA